MNQKHLFHFSRTFLQALPFIALFLVMACAGYGLAQAPDAGAAPPATSAPPVYPARNLAPHVFRPINPQLDDFETEHIHGMYEILAANPDYEWAKSVTYRSDIWYLEIEFKPMRTITLDLPGKDGRLQRQIIWYLIYKVRNPGMVYKPAPVRLDAKVQQHLKTMKAFGNHPLRPERQFYEISQKNDQTLRFIPIFELVTLNARKYDAAGKEVPDRMSYIDRFMPLAVERIQALEDPGRPLLDSVKMTLRNIKPGEEVWGVALWQGVNPTTNKFSILVNGLTNAHQWSEDSSKYGPKTPVGIGQSFKYKTLKLNYWVPGDETSEGQRSETFRMGIPGVDGGVDYRWIYK